MAIDLGNFKGDKGDQGDPGPAGAATTVLGTSNQIVVDTVDTTATVSLDTDITSAIANNIAKTGITQDQADEIDANTLKIGITTAQADAITTNTNKVGITSNQANAINLNTSKITYPASASTKLGTIETNADVTDTTNVVGSLTAGNNITIAANGTISSTGGGADGLSITGVTSLNLLDGTTVLSTVTLPSGGGGSTTVLGTAGEIDVATVGDNATVSISSTITDAIDLNTAKQSVAGLNQVGAAVLSTDSVVYYAGAALAPRRKTFSLVPLSVFNNDSGFGTGDASLANNQTFSGVSTFTNTAGGIKADRITVLNDNESYLELRFTDNISLVAGGDRLVTCSQTSPTENIVRINNSFQDTDFVIRKEGSGEAYHYDSGTDTHTFTGTVNGLGALVPTPPAVGTFTLQSANGVLSWV